MPDILFILLLAPVIFGPKRLPEVARQTAKFMAQFRMMKADFQRQFNAELFKIELEEKQKTAAPIEPQIPELVQPPAPKTLPESFGS